MAEARGGENLCLLPALVNEILNSSCINLRQRKLANGQTWLWTFCVLTL